MPLVSKVLEWKSWIFLFVYIRCFVKLITKRCVDQQSFHKQLQRRQFGFYFLRNKQDTSKRNDLKIVT